MWSFLLGSAVGYIALNNGPLLRRFLKWTIVKTETGIEAAGKEARRTGARLVEDVQDIMAEAAAQQAAAAQNGQGDSTRHNLNIN